MFKSEFQIAAMQEAVATAEKFGSAHQYLLRLQADCEAELASIKIASEQSEYAAQFCPARAHEVYTALAWIALALGLHNECPATYGKCDRSPEGTCYACGGNPRRDKFTVLTPTA
jgi:hypothetical protein